MNDMVDMSQFVEAKSDQLNADDLIGGPRTITVRKVTGSDGDQPVAIFFEGDNNKPFKPCKTMRRVLLAIWKKNASEYVGRSMTIYRDDAVTFGSLATGGIRISHMTGIEKDTVVVVMKSKGKKAGITIKPLVQERQQPRQTADQWAAEHITAVQDAETLDALEALIKRGVGAVGRLNEQNKPLADKVVEAYASRRGQLEREGRPDDAFGDQHDDTAEDQA